MMPSPAAGDCSDSGCAGVGEGRHPGYRPTQLLVSGPVASPYHATASSRDPAALYSASTPPGRAAAIAVSPTLSPTIAIRPVRCRRAHPGPWHSRPAIQPGDRDAGLGDRAGSLQSGNYQAMAFAYSRRLDSRLDPRCGIGDKEHESRARLGRSAARQLLLQAKSTATRACGRWRSISLQRRFLGEVPPVILFNFRPASSHCVPT